MSVTWDVLLDVDRDGVPEYQARTDGLSLQWNRGRKFYLDQAPPGYATVVLDNADRKYNPKNTASPIYPQFTPGILVELRGTVNGTLYQAHRGFVSDIDPRPTRGEQACTLLCYDIAASLQRANHFVGRVRLNTYEGLLVRELCRAYGMREQDIVVDPGPDAVPYAAFSRSTSLLQHIEAVREAALGLFYVNGSGKAVYEDRHHRLIDEHITSQFTFTADMVVDATPQQRVQGTINHAFVTGSPRVLAAQDVIASLSEPKRISPLEVLDLFLPYSNWALNPVTPTASTDYTANLMRDGSSADRTDSLVLTGWIDQGYGAIVQFRSTDSLPIWLTKLEIRGRLLSTPDTFTEAFSSTDSVGNRGEWPKSISQPMVQSQGKARDLAKYLVEGWKDRADEQDLLVTVAADGDDTLAEQLLKLEISDRVTVQIGVADVSADYHIEEMQHNVDLRGTSFVGRYRLRPAPTIVRLFRLDADADSPADSGGLDVGAMPY